MACNKNIPRFRVQKESMRACFSGEYVEQARKINPPGWNYGHPSRAKRMAGGDVDSIESSSGVWCGHLDVG